MVSFYLKSFPFLVLFGFIDTSKKLSKNFGFSSFDLVSAESSRRISAVFYFE